MSEETFAGSESEEPPRGPQSLEEAMESMTETQRGNLRLARIAAAHLLFWLLTMGLFAAADSWHMLSELALASFLSVVTGALAGIATANLIHEWAHFVGARQSGGAYKIPGKIGLFVYDWDFSANSVSQFMTMSKAGTVGGVIAVLLVWWFLPTDTLARAAVFAGAVASFVFGSRIEWPILRRVSDGADPLTELSKIDQGVLWQAFVIASFVGLLTLWVVAP